MASTNTSSMAGSAAIGATTRKGRRRLPVIPPNYFGIAFGLAGLAELWVWATPIWGVSDVVGRVMELVAAVIWLALLLLYLSTKARSASSMTGEASCSRLSSRSLRSCPRCWQAGSAT